MCQVSSTVFQAAFFAGFPIRERTQECQQSAWPASARKRADIGLDGAQFGHGPSVTQDHCSMPLLGGLKEPPEVAFDDRDG